MSSDPDPHDRLCALFEGARRLHGEAREAFLREQCRGDDALRAELEELLEAAQDDAARPDGLDEASIGAARRMQEHVLERGSALAGGWTPERIAGYRVVRRLGEGGMGVVYEALQETPRRRVAIKLLHPLQVTPERSSRFRTEAEVLARLQHPGIAQILQAGTYDAGRGEQPYFAMELVEGVDLRKHCERSHLDRRARLELLARVCDALDYAHQKGVVHRDIKPENVLVDAHGQPKVLDFGIARTTEESTVVRSQMTQDGQILGTLAYMAPEQLRGDASAITARTDVYGLGVLGFELLSGRLPFDVAGLGLVSAIALLQDQDAPSMGTIDRRCRGDVEVIFARALEKEPAARYGSAAALAADLRRHLRDEPILARPPSRAYRLRKVVLRNRGLVTSVALVILSLLVGLGWALVERGKADRRAAEQAAQAYRANLLLAADAVSEGRTLSARSFLDAAPEELRGWEWRYLRGRLDASIRRIEVDATLADFVVAPDGRSLFVATEDGAIQRRDTATGALLGTIRTPGRPVQIALSQAGTQIAALGLEASADPVGFWVGRWSVPEGRSLAVQKLPSSLQFGAARDWNFWSTAPAFPRSRAWLDADRWRLLIQGVDRLLVFDLEEEGPRIGPGIGSAAFFPRGSPDGRFLVLANDPQKGIDELEILDSNTFEPRGRLAGYHDDICGLAFSPDGSRLATTTMDGYLQMWDIEAATRTSAVAQALFTVDTRQGEVRNVQFCADGARLVTSGGNRTIRVWDAFDGNVEVEIPSQEHIPYVAQPLFGSRQVVSANRSALGIFSTELARPTVLRGHASFVYALDVDLELGLILTGGWEGYEGKPGALRLWDLDSGDPVAVWGEAEATGCLYDAAFLPGQQSFIALCGRGSLGGESCVWRIDLAHGAQEVVHRAKSGSMFPWLRALAPAGASDRAWTLTLGDPSSELHRLDLGTGRTTAGGATLEAAERPLPSNWVQHPLAVSPSGRLLAVAPNAVSLSVLRAQDLRLVQELTKPEDSVQAMAFDPEERRLLSCSETGVVRVWDLASGRPIATLSGHDGGVLCAAFDPSGTRIATGGRDGTLRIWSGETYHQLLSLEGHERYVYTLKWLADGERILTASGDHTVRIWETAPVRERYRAQAERQVLVEKLTPRVEAWLSEHAPADLAAMLEAATDLSPRERQVARQIGLGRLLGRPEASEPADERR